MKKISILLLFVWTLCGYSQIKDYTFSQAVSGYSEISTGTLLGNESSNDQNFIDSASLTGGTATVGPGLPIGFDFTFNGLVYDSFGVAADGWISLGSSAASPNHVDMNVKSRWLPLSSEAGTQPANLCASIAALTNDLSAQAGASIMYSLVGTAPNRTLVVQWKKYKRTTSGTGDSFDFQIRLNETSNTVQIAYGDFVSAVNGLFFQVGLRGAPGDVATNFANRTDAALAGWSSTVAGTAATDRMGVTGTYIPQKGLTFTWTPPTCGGIKDLVVNNIGTDSAVLNWGTYTPTPSGFEYIVTANTALPTGSGTATTAKSANITGLSQNTLYSVFMRTHCNSQYTQWMLISTFKTKCADVSILFEDFDSYNLLNTTMPDCWGRAVTSLASPATVAINMADSSVAPASGPNRLMMSGNGSSSNLGTTYAILPAMSNLQSGRLKFKAYATQYQGHRTLDVGYYTNSNDVSTFQILGTINLNSTAPNAIEYIITPGSLPGVKNLGFRNSGVLGETGAAASTTVFIDDVKWEPIPTCADVTAVAAKDLTHASANISWTAETTTAWQYAYSPASVTNPYSLTGIDVPGAEPKVQITGLSAATVYKVWIRSKCGTSLGAWIGPLVFETTCAPVAEFAQNFDLQNSLPNCWKKVGTMGAVLTTQTTSPAPPSSPNTLKIDGQANQPTIVALPPLSTSQSGIYQLKLKLRGSATGVKLEIGYLTDVTDAESFTAVTSVTTGLAFSSETINLGADVKSPYVAFRNPAFPVGSVFIDDVVWEAIPTCPYVSDITATTVGSNSATLKWTPGESESQWQYVLGTANDINPFVLPALNVPNPVYDGMSITATINGLSSNATNKIWIRSKCSATSVGSWVGPLNVVTPCAAGTAFTQNFDSSSAIPSCWAKSGATGTVSVNGDYQGGASAPNQLTLQATTVSGAAVVAMPPMSNTNAGTHRLTFKYRNTSGSNLLEVGYLTNIGEPTSFVPLATLTCSTVFQDGVVELGAEPASQILAFRNNGNAIINIDNVAWALIPPCESIKNLAVSSVGDTSISFNWTKGASETAWQYAVGTSAATSPAGLTVYNVTGDPSASATNLSASVPLAPSTTYKIWVRSKCSSSSLGTWIGPISATTTCAGVANFTENFATNALPSCWTRVGIKGTVNMSTSLSEPNDGYKLFMYSSSTTDASIVAMPPLSTAASGDHILKFKFKGTMPATKLEVGYISNILDPASFLLIDTFEAPSTEVSQVFTVSLPASPVSHILAFRNPGLNNAAVLIDNVSWSLAQSTAPACATNVTATPNAICGRYATVISWDAVATADGYLLDVSTAPDGSYVLTDQNLGTALSYSFMGNSNTTYYFRLKPYNYKGTATGCAQLSFVTNATECYCISVPAANDNQGIANVQVGASNFAIPDVTYSDLTAKPINIAQGANNNLKVTFNTYLPYSAAVWVDYNNDYNFDASELVSNGASSASWMSVVDVSFAVPANAALGMHRMRIATWSGGHNSGYSPCYNGPYGVTLDFNVNVVVPAGNDNSAGAIPLVIGSDFAANAVTGTNVNATGSFAETAPDCGGYNGMDVWYKAVVPASGSLTFEVNSVSGGITNTAAAAYFMVSSTLTLAKCDDSSSTAGGDQPKMTFKSWSAGEVLYFRVWENGGDALGSFKVSAYDSTLGVDAFDSVNFSYYPNPVKDILNLSFNAEISNVSIVNLLGQQVISKAVNANQVKVDMSQLSVGTYLVRVTVGNQLKTIKVVKE